MTDMRTVADLRDKVITYVATDRHPWSPTETVDLLIAAVRHEHGERIAKAQEQVAEAVRVGLKGNKFQHADAAADAVLECARLTRAISAPP